MIRKRRIARRALNNQEWCNQEGTDSQQSAETDGALNSEESSDLSGGRRAAILCMGFEPSLHFLGSIAVNMVHLAPASCRSEFLHSGYAQQKGRNHEECVLAE